MAKALFLVTLLTVVVGVGELRKSRAVNKAQCQFYGQGKDGKVGGGRGYFREVGEIGALGSGLLRSKQEMELLENG